jgi:hypothetical protein
MHPQKKWGAWVHGSDGYDLSRVKKKPPQMDEDRVDCFADPDAEQQEGQDAPRVQKGPARLAQPPTRGQYPDE